MLRLSQRPLTGSSLDTELFVDRVEELEAALRGLRFGLNAAVVGPSGSGRTSFLHQLRTRLDRPAAYVEGRAWTQPRELVLALRAAMGDDPRFAPRYESVDDAIEEQAMEFLGMRRLEDAPPPLTEREVERLVNAAAANENRERVEILFVDDPNPRAMQLLFGAFRDTLWTMDLLWVVSARDDLRSTLLAPPANAFFGTVVDLGPLRDQDAVEVLRRRAAQDEGSEASARLEQLSAEIAHSITHPQPRQLIEAAAAALQSPEPQRVLDALTSAHAKASGLGRTEAMLFEEMRHLGPVHAGDEQLLQRMGLTRPRIVQALGTLEEEGLVVGEREGRRKIYRVTVPSTHETRGVDA